MNTGELAQREHQDKWIKHNHCIFITQIHLQCPIMEEMSKTRRLVLPDEARKKLKSAIGMFQNYYCGRSGLICNAYDTRTMVNDITVRFENKKWLLEVMWGGLFRVNNIKENAVISIWTSEGSLRWNPMFFFRLDGYANDGEPLPALPDWKDDYYPKSLGCSIWKLIKELCCED